MEKEEVTQIQNYNQRSRCLLYAFHVHITREIPSNKGGEGRIYCEGCMLRFHSDLGALAFNQVPSGKMSSSILRLVG